MIVTEGCAMEGSGIEHFSGALSQSRWWAADADQIARESTGTSEQLMMKLKC